MDKTIIEKLFETENDYVKKLNNIVLDAIAEEKLLSEKLIQFEDLHPPFTSRLADKITRFGGSWKFILSFFIVMLLWMAANLYFLSKPFDPFPFGLLTMIVSLEAIFLSLFVLISQNRGAAREKVRNDIEYEVNIKAELEIRGLHNRVEDLQQILLGHLQRIDSNVEASVKMQTQTGTTPAVSNRLNEE